MDVRAAHAASVVAHAASAATGTSSTSSTADKSTSTTSKTESGKSFADLFADAKKDLKKGESLTKVDGHEFARIKGGTRDDQCVNLSGNARSGQAFDLIWRDGRQFHVYGGKGADHKVVEVGHKAATTTPATGGTDSTSTTDTSTTTPSTTTSSTGTTSDDSTSTDTTKSSGATTGATTKTTGPTSASDVSKTD